MIKTSDIKFSKISPERFEELCYKLIRRFDFKDIRWTQGSADNGRDIQAIKNISNGFVEDYTEKWFFECKCYRGGVPADEFESKFAWATTEKADHLVFILSSHITNSGDNYFEKRIGMVSYHVHLIQGNELKEILINHPDLIEEFDLNFSISKFQQIIKDQWIVNNKLPKWNTIISTIEEINLEKISLNELLQLGSLLVISKSIEQLSEDDIQFHYSTLDIIIKCSVKKIHLSQKRLKKFNFQILSEIEWLDNNSFEEMTPYYGNETYAISVNTTIFKNVKSLFGVLSAVENNIQKLYPFFISQDEKLSLSIYDSIEEQCREDFCDVYQNARPIENVKLQSNKSRIFFKANNDNVI